MNQELTHRRACLDDLEPIVSLLSEDKLGQFREQSTQEMDQRYIDAFELIDVDTNQYLMVVEMDKKIVGTCHLTVMPSLTFTGSTRLQIEAVRVSEKYRGKKIGEWMMNSAIEYGKSKGATIIQLSSNKEREQAIKFYERIGFESTHEGMKLYLK